MTTALEKAIGSLSDPSVALADALRRLLVVSRRIGADALSAWLMLELNGYGEQEAVPGYRTGKHLPIRLHFDGMFQSSSSMRLSGSELPAELASVMANVSFHEPAAELDALAHGTDDPHLPLPLAWVGIYRRLADEGRAPRIEGMVLNRATIAMPRTHLKGILDRVKSTALDLALNIEDVSVHAGEAGGPTILDDPGIARAVQIFIEKLYASDSTITIANEATVAHGVGARALRVEAGDLAALLDVATDYIAEREVDVLAGAITRDGGTAGDETRSFLERVRGGGVALAAGIATNAAYDGLLELIRSAFPHFLV